MKTLLIVIFALSISNLSYSQNPTEKSKLDELAIANTLTKSLNTDYLNNVNSKDTPIKVLKLQNMAAMYKIEETKIYNSKSSSTYDVVFEESNCKIVATYNNKGEIISSVEEFKNIRLPLKLSTTISKKYPKWSFSGNTHSINYDKKDGAKKTYIVKIKNGSTSKILKFSMVEKPQISYLAVN